MTLSRAVAPLTSGIDQLEDLPSRLRRGGAPGPVANSFGDVVNKVKDAGRSSDAEGQGEVPSAGEPGGG